MIEAKKAFRALQLNWIAFSDGQVYVNQFMSMYVQLDVNANKKPSHYLSRFFHRFES